MRRRDSSSFKIRSARGAPGWLIQLSLTLDFSLGLGLSVVSSIPALGCVEPTLKICEGFWASRAYDFLK